MKKTFLSFICISFAFTFQNLKAQSFAREVIGSAGTFATSAYGSMEWTVGEVMTETYASNGNFFTQGFHQPSILEVIIKPTDLFIPEGFSPNLDGINDVFVVRGIENYPANSIKIYNRWGQQVFEASPYTNTWEGKFQSGLTVGGDKLPVGTYFYLLDLGNGTSIYKGTIYLNN
ncbi:MAG: gliding motility-associated C-terminal domain-containing protein [Bacteroidota bacterium]|nr:gliding motility-associated C-terminal domain-containing protein [Bacteroidota bacterium]